MSDTTTRPSGLVLTKIDDRTIEWANPPSGSNAKGTIRRTLNAGDSWSASNLESLRSGNWLISVRGCTLQRAIEQIESHIEQEQRTRQEEIDAKEREKAEKETQERQAQEEEQRLNEYLDDLFNKD